MRKLNQFKAFVIFISVAAIIATVVITMILDTNNVVVRSINDGVSGIQSVFVNIFADVENFGQRTFDFFETYDENVRLRNQMYSTELAHIENRLLQEELEILRAMLEVDETLNDFERISAVTTGRDLTSWNDFIMLNRGASHGVELGQAVVSAEGYLIGRITEVNQFSSRMHLMKPHNNDILAHVQLLGVDGSDSILHGYDSDTGELIVRQVRRNVDVEIGNRVITTGLSDRFPRGLLAGYVVRIEISTDGLTQNLFLTNNVNYNDLRFVFIINRSVEDPLP